MVNPVKSGDARVPWPGPRPYEEESWKDFYGRGADVSDLLDRMQSNKLTILLGASGCGKTSLIRAGLVPLLRHERYHPKGNHSSWPVLLFRRWGSVARATLTENLLLQLGSAIDAISDWGHRQKQIEAVTDARNLRSDLDAILQAKSGNSIVFEEVIWELTNAEAGRTSERTVAGKNEGGLILVFDQFEEQLRAGSRLAAEAVELIGNLYRGGVPIRIILSMRQEYRYGLRRLELTIGGLSTRSIYVSPLKAPAVMKVVEHCSEAADLPIDRDVAERIVHWLAFDSEYHPRENLQEGEDGSGREDEMTSPNLLKLQAVLLEFSRYVLGQGRDRANMAIFEEFCSQFVASAEDSRYLLTGPNNSQVREKWTEMELSQRVLGGALERWIEAAVWSEPSDGFASTSRHNSQLAWVRMTEEELRQQVRRISIRVAPLLSSSDYKLSQEENTLFREALGEEIAKLGIKEPYLRARIRILHENEDEDKPDRLNWDELGLVESLSTVFNHNLSGLARVQNWSPMETGDQIVGCFKETLYRLTRANILQRTTFGPRGEVYWELVHDQFGPSLMKWAVGQKYTWDDCRSSLVICSGLQPIAVPVSEISPAPGQEFYDLDKISWQGCGIENHRSERLTMRNVRFRGCYLAGTIFDAIDFVGCCFEDCDLTGVLFRSCSFRPDDNGQPTTFSRCDSNITIVRGTIDSLELRNCHLHQPAILDTMLKGEVRYTQGSRVLQAFYDVTGASESRSVRISFDATSRAFQCTATRSSFGFLDFEVAASSSYTAPLSDDFRMRPWHSESQEWSDEHGEHDGPG